MYTDWKDYFKPYVPHEDFIPDNICSKSLNSFIFFVFLGAIISFGLISKVDSKSITHKNATPNQQKTQKIKEGIKSLEAKNTLLESEILILNYELSRTFESRERHEILKLSKLTGTHKQVGPGITITLSDNDQPLKQDENPNLGIIHNTDLLQVVNDLWEGKAEAISINGQRITASSEINCIGPTILINRTRITQPFVIKAIGNPEKLMKTIKNGYIQTLELYGIKYFVEKYERMEIQPDSTIILAGDF